MLNSFPNGICMVAYLPKATVQAAIGGFLIDLTYKKLLACR